MDAPHGYDCEKIKWRKHSGGGERNVISTEIMFATFTGTCIRPEEDALPRPSAVTEILFRGLRLSLSFSRFLIKSAG